VIPAALVGGKGRLRVETVAGLAYPHSAGLTRRTG
jgi:hypothetical protein